MFDAKGSTQGYEKKFCYFDDLLFILRLCLLDAFLIRILENYAGNDNTTSHSDYSYIDFLLIQLFEKPWLPEK